MNKNVSNSTSIKAMFLTILLTVKGYMTALACKDERCYIDLSLAKDDDAPLFRFLNNDGYSAIDLREDEYGAYCLWFFLKEYDYENFKEVVPSLVGLALNRLLTNEERKIAAYIADIYEDCLTYGDREIERLYKSLIADNTWKLDILIPVQVTLYLLSDDPERLLWIEELHEIIKTDPDLANGWIF